MQCQIGQQMYVLILPTNKHLATLQPSVPAPNNRQRVVLIFSRFSSGSRRQRISFKFKSTADSANLTEMREYMDYSQNWTNAVTRKLGLVFSVML